ncbi:MAG: DUF4198 domain-containing protein [Elusimicrobiota bacterium]
MKILSSVIGFLLFYSLGFCHEHWIDLENFRPSIRETTKVFACSGHNFPKSDVILSERVFNGFKVITPENKEKLYKTKPDKNLNVIVSEVFFEEEGTYIILFSLQRQPLKNPIYTAKSLVTVGQGNELKYFLKCGLEIVPEKEVSQLKLGEELPIKIFYDGKPVSLTASISINGKKNFFLRTNKDGQLILKIKSSGKYLITTSYKGIGSSLTFFISEGKK